MLADVEQIVKKNPGPHSWLPPLSVSWSAARSRPRLSREEILVRSPTLVCGCTSRHCPKYSGDRARRSSPGESGDLRGSAQSEASWSVHRRSARSSGLCAIVFGLLAAVYGLSTVMPNWAAALVVSVASGSSPPLHPRRAVSIDADRPDAGQDDSEPEGERGMVETTAEIATHIETTRGHLGANLDALEQKIKSATDWREYFRAAP